MRLNGQWTLNAHFEIMTVLPNCAQAIVPPAKIEHYLLNFEHPQGKTKALFFSKFGYSHGTSIQFVRALRLLACESIVVEVEEKPPFGIRITTEGRLRTPDMRNPRVRVGWFLNEMNGIPRLVTVIPAKSK